MLGDNAKNNNYELTGIVLHKGRDLSHGHYVAVTKKLEADGTEAWYNCDDQEIERVDDPASVLEHKRDCYMFLYRKVE